MFASVSTILQLNFGTIPTVWYIFRYCMLLINTGMFSSVYQVSQNNNIILHVSIFKVRVVALAITESTGYELSPDKL